MRSGAISSNNVSKIDPDQGKQKTDSYILLMTLPNAQSFPPEYGISYANSRLAHLGVKVDSKFKIEPFEDERAQTVTYTLRADLTPAQAQKVRREGFTVERDRPVHAQPES
jgi:hypothetical protein